MPRLVRAVSLDRWLEAQEWERSVWERAERRPGWRRLVWPLASRVYSAVGIVREADDWNHWWATQFDEYSFLPADLGDFIELGCGPYTNARLILRGRSARRVVCSDPLARTYATFRGRWLAEAYRRGKVELDDHPIEELPLAPASFDVVVVINVLDHVRDADLCLRTSIGLLRPGGWLLLGQDLTVDEDAARFPLDIGHPIRLRREDVDAHVRNLEPVLRKDLDRMAGRNPKAHYSTLVFSGKRSTAEERSSVHLGLRTEASRR